MATIQNKNFSISDFTPLFIAIYIFEFREHPTPGDMLDLGEAVDMLELPGGLPNTCDALFPIAIMNCQSRLKRDDLAASTSGSSSIGRPERRVAASISGSTRRVTSLVAVRERASVQCPAQ